MKQVIVDYIPFQITPQQINEAMKENNGKLVVKGVLQRAEAKNQKVLILTKVKNNSLKKVVITIGEMTNQ